MKTCLAVRHVAFEDLGLLGPLAAARGYEVRYHNACVDRFTPEVLLAPDLVIALAGPIGVYGKAGIDPRNVRIETHRFGPAAREPGGKVFSTWLESETAEVAA